MFLGIGVVVFVGKTEVALCDLHDFDSFGVDGLVVVVIDGIGDLFVYL